MSYEIVDLLNHINANGTTVVMVTHEHNLVRHFHHRVITIDQGTVVSDSLDTDELPSDYAAYEAQHPVRPVTNREMDEIDIMFNEVSSDTKKEIVEKIVNTEIKIDENKGSEFFVEPNSDSDVEDFIQNYGVDTDDDIAEDDVDYSELLDSLSDEKGGND